MSTSEQPFRWGSIALPALLPTMLFSIGEGAIIPIIPIAADNLGASLAIAGLVAAVLAIGELFGNIPSGWLVARVGERPAMIGATALSVVGLVICVIAPNPLALSFGIFFIGLSAAVFALARHAFMTSFVPIAYRARALSTLGGTLRLGYFIGPFVTAAVIHLTGSATSAFWIHVVACLGSAIVLITLPDPTKTFGAVATVRLAGRDMREGEALAEQESAGLFRTIYNSRAVLSQLGLGAVIRVLWLTPAMDRLWMDAASERRRFLDRVTLSLVPKHGEAVLAYDRSLRERNRLLRDGVRDAAWYEAIEGRIMPVSDIRS